MHWVRPAFASWLLVSATGCNQFFGLNETSLVDAPDAKFRGCPALGETPAFSTLPTALTTGEFPFDYTFDEARTFAVANIINTGIVEGAVDSMDLATIDLARDAGDFLTSPRVAPEGDEMFMVIRDAANQWSMRLYTRTAPRTWVRGATSAMLDPAQQISTPTRRTPERRMMRRDVAGSQFIEYAERAGGWTPVGQYDRTALGITSTGVGLEDPQLSPDGLRLVFGVREIVGQPIFYTDRSSIDAMFGPAREILRLSGDAEARDPILTLDCVRMYFVVYPGLTFVEQ